MLGAQVEFLQDGRSPQRPAEIPQVRGMAIRRGWETRFRIAERRNRQAARSATRIRRTAGDAARRDRS